MKYWYQTGSLVFLNLLLFACNISLSLYLNNDNYPILVKTVPFNFSKSQKGQFKITDTLSGIYEIVPFGTIPFNGQQFPLYFTPKSNWSISVLIYEAKNLDGDILKPPDPYILFKLYCSKNISLWLVNKKVNVS